VEFPDNPSRDHQREKRESRSVELLGKLSEVKALDKGLPKKCRSRKIDSMIPNNGAKMLSRNLYFPKAKGRWILNWCNKEDDLSLSP
jgi:hypothetical protein